jgi:hypothetical protein
MERAGCGLVIETVQYTQKMEEKVLPKVKMLHIPLTEPKEHIFFFRQHLYVAQAGLELLGPRDTPASAP